MGIVNRRNAVIGWVVLKAGKRAAKKKARTAAPGGGRLGKVGAGLAGVLAAAAGLFAFLRRRGDGE